jgi:hypothetical protein
MLWLCRALSDTGVDKKEIMYTHITCMSKITISLFKKKKKKYVDVRNVLNLIFAETWDKPAVEICKQLL